MTRRLAWAGMSVFGRTFALMIAALIIAETIGLALMLNRPPLRNAPVQLSDVARYLTAGPPGGRPSGPFGEPGPRTDRGPPERGGRDGLRPGPPPGGDDPPPGRREWRLLDAAAAPPAPGKADAAESAALQALLAQRLALLNDDVRVFVLEGSGPARGRDPRDSDPTLHAGFVAARRLDSGNWRVMESVVEGFPNEFQRQVFWLFALGLAALLPLAWLFARALSRPIRRFSDAATRLGSDLNAPALDRDGPAEMLAAIDSFNAMQAKLSRMHEERTQMIAAIAHDLRTPLTRLAFRLDDLPSPLKEKVEGDIQEMKLMISAVLDFMRERSRGGRHERLDFRMLVESVVDDHSDVGHDVTLEAGKQVAVSGDPVALRRMVVNIVDNALKYGQRARLKLRPDGGQTVLDVDDDGPGIPEPLQNRVFEPFFRAESSRNRDTGGIGLGLAAVRSIVVDHGGNVTVHNRAGGGLRVSIALSVAPA